MIFLPQCPEWLGLKVHIIYTQLTQEDFNLNTGLGT